MVIESLALAAVAVLGPYLAKAGQTFSEKAGEALAQKAGELYQVIKRRFAGDTYAETTLARAEEQPAAENRLAALKLVLTEKIQGDPQFATAVRRLVEEARAVDHRNVIAHGIRGVAVGGDVTSSTIITGDTRGPVDARDAGHA
jgi:hypothetical protein